MKFPRLINISYRPHVLPAPKPCFPVKASHFAFTSASSRQTSSREDHGPHSAAATARQQHGALPQKKSYILPMFPYPSGSLHMGHVRVYTISDVVARYHRMKGFHVLHPIGWDAFGLPAENAAIERGIDPAAWTAQNIVKMKQQLRAMSVDFDWDREFMTCSPAFYKHTQKLFLMLLKRGLAYQADALVNWDPVDQTVLANEQVDSDGRSWRSGAIVEKVQLRQWFFRITKYQNALLRDLDNLAERKQWPERVLTQQRNWIGHSTGAKIKFAVHGGDGHFGAIDIYSTRPDTLFGVKYLALSTTHPLVQDLARRIPDLQAFLDGAPDLPLDSKQGYLLSDIRASSPLNHIFANGTYDKHVPVYVAPYVVGGYGQGAVMGVPGHDATDLAFWRQQSSSNKVTLVINDTLTRDHVQPDMLAHESSTPFVSRGVLNDRCGKYAGLKSAEGADQIVQDLIQHGEHASLTENWRLRDWLISRQRYWGTPIPIVHCAECGPVPIPDDQLPVELPELDQSIKGKLGNPLDNVASWVNTICPNCQRAARRETDTMDTFVDSSWYFMRFPDAQNDNQMVSKQAAAALLPVDTYVGGVEHAILHLLYARFIYKFLADEGWPGRDASSNDLLSEPFQRLVSQGMVHGKTFSDPSTGRFLHPSEVQGADTSTPTIRASGRAASVSFEKMSKSKHNGVDPADCIAKYGADAVRAHILFSAPVSEILEWDEEKIVGIQRWFGRVSKIVEMCCKPATTSTSNQAGLLSLLIQAEKTPLSVETVEDTLKTNLLTPDDLELLLFVNTTISAINNILSDNIYALNNAISTLIKLTNKISSNTTRMTAPPTNPDLLLWSTSTLLRMLAPIAPTFAQQNWLLLLRTNLGQEPIHTSHRPGSDESTSISHAPFPDPPLTPHAATALSQRRTSVPCVVQINGKIRFDVRVPADAVTITATTAATPSKKMSKDDIAAPSEEVDVDTRKQEEEEKEKEKEEEELVSHLLSTKQGQLWLTQRNDWACRKRVIVVKRADGARIVNVVFGKGESAGGKGRQGKGERRGVGSRE